MRAIRIVLAALVVLTIDRAYGFLGYNVYNEAKSTYYEIITECEREGGECKEVDFAKPEPPPTPAPPPPTRPPLPPPTMPPPTAPPQVFFPQWNWPFFFPPTMAPTPPVVPFHQFARANNPYIPAPRPVTRAPRPATRAPRPATRAPRPSTRAPRIATKAPPPKKAMPKKPRKNANKKKRKPRRRMKKGGEQEREARKRRAVGPDPFDHLYNECSGGWEFDLGCSAKGKNVCCYSSSGSSGSSTR